MFSFSIYGWITIIVVFILCFAILIFLWKRVKDRLISKRKSSRWKYNMIYISMGFLLVALSIVSFINIQSGYQQEFKILSGVYILVSEPIRIMAITGALIGITFIIIGIRYRRANNMMPGT